MNQVCRACLTTKDKFNYFLCENVPADVYWFCTSIEVSQDNLPKSLCNICYTLITKYSQFKRTCIESQNSLINLKDNLKNEDVNQDIKLVMEYKNEDKIKDVDIKNKIDVGVQNIAVKIENTDQHKSNIGLQDVTVKVEEMTDQCNTDFIHDVSCFEVPVVRMNEVKTRKRNTKKFVKLRGNKKNEKLKVKRKPYTFSCERCHKKFNHRERFEAHKQEHEGKTVSIVCLPCNKTFMTWSGLRRHNEIEHTLVNLEKLKCNICGKLSKSRQTLRVHQKIHGERSVLVCDVCGKGFATSVILKKHLETHKEDRERPFACEQCGKKFYTQSTLQTHVSRRHTGRRYICHICSYPFTDKYNLSKHLLIHEGKKMFKCDVCGKSFTSHSTLIEHKRLHSGERPYSCTYCVKCFVSKRALNEHTRTHTGEKPYKCEVCEQSFSQSGSLRRHLKVHERMVTLT